MLWLYATLLMTAEPAAKVKPFAERAALVKVGTSKEPVRALLGAPLEGKDEASWVYHDPPDRPDGPYHWYRYTFAKGRVTKVEDGGVACVLRE